LRKALVQHGLDSEPHAAIEQRCSKASVNSAGRVAVPRMGLCGGNNAALGNLDNVIAERFRHRVQGQRAVDEPLHKFETAHCSLLVFIDDATSKLMQLRFVPSESTDSYFSALQGYLNDHGCPVAFYSDKHTVFRVNRPDAMGGSGMTQFGRALAELNIEILCANSSQAKGRVERANRTLQDRLVKELRLAGICDMAAGNLFLPSFVEHFNERFALPAQKTENLHRALHVKATQLTDILCHREQRHVSQQLTMAYDRKQIILERSEISEKLAGQYVEIYDFIDQPLEVRWKGHLLPYRVFSKDQRVSHTAVAENKRLGHALAMVKAQQDIKHVPKVMTNSAKGGYKKNPRRLYGPDYKPKIAAAPAMSAAPERSRPCIRPWSAWSRRF